MNLTVVAIGILALYLGGNWFVDGASRLAMSFGVPQLIVGLTVVTIVTSTPELLIGITAASRDAGGIVMGVVTGSNIANIGLMLGISGLIARRMRISSKLVRRGIPIMLGVGVITYAFMFLRVITPVVGVIFIIGYIAFNIFMLRTVRRDSVIQKLATTTQDIPRLTLRDTQDILIVDEPHLLADEEININRLFEIVRLTLGIIVLLIGADYIVRGTLDIAGQLGANEVVLGATLVALATSIPELFTVIIATNRKQPDVVLGAVIGSSVTNLLLVVGIASFIEPVTFDVHLLRFEYPVMIVLMLSLIPIAVDRRLVWYESLFYLLAYIAFFVGILVT